MRDNGGFPHGSSASGPTPPAAGSGWPSPTQPLPHGPANGPFPSGQYPTGQVAGQFPPGYLPPGQYPSGQYPTGPVPAGPYATGPFPAGQPPYAPRRRRRGWVVPLVVLVVLALLLPGIYVVVTKLSGGGRQPESLVPADALAFAKIDLDPGVGQKVAAYRLAKKLPGQQGKSDEDVRNDLLGRLFEDGDVDFSRDIKPWLGDRVALAALPASGSDEPVPLGVLQVKDEAGARRFLDGQRSDGALGYVLRDGYALVGDEQADVERASRDAAVRSLQDDDRFSDDLGRLHGGKIAAAWVDLAALFRALEASDPEEFEDVPALRNYQGRVVAGISAADDALELEARLVGARAVPKGEDVLDRLRDLPAGTPVGAALSGSALTSDPDTRDAIDQALDEAGEDLESDYGVGAADIRDLLRGNAVFGLAGIPRDEEDPKLAVLVDGLSDPSRGARTIEALIKGESDSYDDSDYGSDDDSDSGSSDPDVTVQQTGSGVVVSTDPDYAGKVTQRSAGRLGDDKLFRRAMEGAPENTYEAAYIAVQPILDVQDAEDVPAEARVVQAVGVTLGTDGDEVVLHARAVID